MRVQTRMQLLVPSSGRGCRGSCFGDVLWRLLGAPLLSELSGMLDSATVTFAATSRCFASACTEKLTCPQHNQISIASYYCCCQCGLVKYGNLTRSTDVRESPEYTGGIALQHTWLAGINCGTSPREPSAWNWGRGRRLCAIATDTVIAELVSGERKYVQG